MTTRRLAAILAADVAGYSRLMAADEAGTLARFKLLRADHVEPAVRRHNGRVVGEAGDSLLMEFPTASDAVTCAVEVQKKLAVLNADLPGERRMQFRMGVNLGEVIVDGATIHGDGVNVAARLEKLAEPGAIVVAHAVREQAKGRVACSFEDLGEQALHNIAEPVRAYRVGAGIATPAVATAPLPAAAERPTVAVLPFNNMSGDPEQEYFSDGITEDIITELARFKNLLVIARNSAFAFKGQAVDVKEVGSKLGVRFVVEGSVRRAGNRVRITAQLIDVESAGHLWAERYDRELADIFAVQDEVVRAIAGALPGQLDRHALEIARSKRTESLTAYDLALRGRFGMWNASSDKYEAITLFEKAVAIDPAYGPAHVGLAQMYAYGIYTLGLTWEEATAKCRHHVELALALDNFDAMTHANAGHAYILCGEHDRAGLHSARALALNPNDVFILSMRGNVLAYLGSAAEGMALCLLSERLQPFSPDDGRIESLFDAQYMAGAFADAVAAYRRLRSPERHMMVECAAALARLGRIEEASALVHASREGAPENWTPETFARYHPRMCKRPEEKELWLDGYRKAGIDV